MCCAVVNAILILTLFFCLKSNSTSISPIEFKSTTEFESTTELDDELKCDMAQELSATVIEVRSVFSGTIVNNDSFLANLTFIDRLRQLFIKMETQLWIEIAHHIYEKNIETVMADLLVMLQYSYSFFLLGNFHEYSVDLNLFDPYDEILFDCITTINATVHRANLTYLNATDMIKNYVEILSIVQDNFLMNKPLNEINKYITFDMTYLMNVSQ